MGKNSQKKKKKTNKRPNGHVSRFKAAEKRKENVPLFTTSDVILQPPKKEKVHKAIGSGHRRKKRTAAYVSVRDRLKNAHTYEAMSTPGSGLITLVQHRPMDLYKYIRG